MALPPDFVGYEPLPQPGAYAFQRRDGNPLVLQGPLAEKLRSQLDASAGPDMRVAGPGGGRNVVQPGSAQAKALQASVDAGKPPAPAPAAVPAMQASPGSRSVLSPEQAAKRRAEEQAANDADWAKRDAAAQAAKANAPATPAAPGPTAPAAPAAPAAAGPEIVATGKNGQKFYRDERGNLRVVSKGSAGKSKASLEATADQGVATPQTTEVIREGGQVHDPNYLADMADLSIDQRLLNQQVADRQAAGAAAESLAFAEEAGRAQERVKLENTVAEEAKTAAKQAEVEYDTARQELRNSKIDPNRMFHGPLGSFKMIGAAIAQAAGAYGATLGRTQNFAQQIVQSAIDRDIAAQQEAIRIRGMDADNALARMTRKLGNQKAAEATLRSAQGEYAANLFKARAAASKRPEIMEAAQRFDLAEQQRQVELRRQYLQEVAGKTTEKTLAKYAYATPGTPGRDGPATIEEQTAYENLQGKKLGNVEQDLKNQNATEGGDVSKEAASNFATISSLKGDIERTAAAAGYKVDPTTGTITQARPDAGFPSRGKGLVPGLPNAPEHDRTRSDLVKIGRSTAGVLNPQGEPSPALVEANTPDAAAPDANIIARLESAYQLALERERALGAGAKPKERATLEKRRQAVTVEQNQRAGQPATQRRQE